MEQGILSLKWSDDPFFRNRTPLSRRRFVWFPLVACPMSRVLVGMSLPTRAIKELSRLRLGSRRKEVEPKE